MFSVDKADTSEELYYERVGGSQQIHPYSMTKQVNRSGVEVLHKETDGNSRVKRWVLLRNGRFRVWVRVKHKAEYGYELQPEERVSEAEVEAIQLKHAAKADGADVSVTDARRMLESGEPEQRSHALIALYYAAKADPEVSDEDVDELRELMYEKTDHVDRDHQPTVQKILEGTDVTGRT